MLIRSETLLQDMRHEEVWFNKKIIWLSRN